MNSIARARQDVAWDLEGLNDTLDGASPETIVRWALAQNLSVVTSTSFGPQSAAMLHLTNKLGPGLRHFGSIQGLPPPARESSLVI